MRPLLSLFLLHSYWVLAFTDISPEKETYLSSPGIDVNIPVADKSKLLDPVMTPIANNGSAFIEIKPKDFSGQPWGKYDLMIRIIYKTNMNSSGNVEKRIQENVPITNLKEFKIELPLILPLSEVEIYLQFIDGGLTNGKPLAYHSIIADFKKSSMTTFCPIYSVKKIKGSLELDEVDVEVKYGLKNIDPGCHRFSFSRKVIYPYLGLEDSSGTNEIDIPQSEINKNGKFNLKVIPCTFGQIVLQAKCKSPSEWKGQLSVANFNIISTKQQLFKFSTHEINGLKILRIYHPKSFGKCRGLKISIEGKEKLDDSDEIFSAEDIMLFDRMTEIASITENISQINYLDITIQGDEEKEFRQIQKIEIDQPNASEIRLSADKIIESFRGELIDPSQVFYERDIHVEVSNDNFDQYTHERNQIEQENEFNTEENKETDDNSVVRSSKKQSIKTQFVYIIIFAGVCLFVFAVFSFILCSNKNNDRFNREENSFASARVNFIDDDQAAAFNNLRNLKKEETNKKKGLEKSKIKSFDKFVEYLRKNNVKSEISADSPFLSDSKINDQFSLLKSLDFDQIFSKDAYLLPHNKQKIRSNDVFCYDHSRVELVNSKGDFIHANYVPNLSDKECFIVTQAPKNETCEDFWLMTFQKNVCLIISIVTEYEYLQYNLNYIPEDSTPVLFGQIEVTSDPSTTELFFNTSKVKLRNKTTGEEKHLLLLKFMDWPDHAKPKHPCLLKPAIDKITDIVCNTENEHRPIIAHCVAGMGRSGALVTIQSSLKEMIDQNKESCNPTAYVCYANQWRHLFNLSLQPFYFSLLFINNYLISKKFQLSSWNQVLKFDWKNLNSKKISFRRDQDEVNYVKYLYDHCTVIDPDRSEGGVTKKERIQMLAPFSSFSYTVKTLLTENKTNGDFINASYIPGLKANEYIITQNPLETTVKDFWNMVMYNKLQNIVFFGSAKGPEEGKRPSFIPGNGDVESSLETDHLKVKILLISNNKGFTQYKCRISSNQSYNMDNEPIEFKSSIIFIHDWSLRSFNEEFGKNMILKLYEVWKNSIHPQYNNLPISPLLLVDQLGSSKATQIAILITMLRVQSQIGLSKSHLYFDLTNFLQLISLHRPGCFGSIDDFQTILESIGYIVSTDFK